MSDVRPSGLQNFKQCSNCAYRWATREAFLSDPAVSLVGYQVNFRRLEAGFFLFNHLLCETTIAVPVEEFQTLYAGPVFSERLTDSEKCPGYCQREDELRPCPAQCECAYVREILQIIAGWEKGT